MEHEKTLFSVGASGPFFMGVDGPVLTWAIQFPRPGTACRREYVISPLYISSDPSCINRLRVQGVTCIKRGGNIIYNYVYYVLAEMKRELEFEVEGRA